MPRDVIKDIRGHLGPLSEHSGTPRALVVLSWLDARARSDPSSCQWTSFLRPEKCISGASPVTTITNPPDADPELLRPCRSSRSSARALWECQSAAAPVEMIPYVFNNIPGHVGTFFTGQFGTREKFTGNVTPLGKSQHINCILGSEPCRL